MMYRVLGICIVLAAEWLMLTMAGDFCPIRMRFCSCYRYPIQLPSIDNSSRSVAPTTAPKGRDPFQHTVVECHLNGTERSSLVTVASNLHRKLVDKLVIVGMPLENEQVLATLPPRWLENTRIKQFEITQTALSGDFLWKDDPFVGQGHTLVWLAAIRCSLTGSLTYNTLGTVNLKGLEELPGIEGLDLSMNHLVSVEKSAFSKPSHLQTVVLSKNAIQDVSPGAFINLQRLRHVDLSHNLLVNVSRDIFAKQPKLLRSINFSWNRLKSLPKDLFSNMTALKVVDASFNFLYSLPQEPWESIWGQLKHIDVSGNFIQCNCDLLWMFSNTTHSGSLKKKSVKGQCARSLPTLFVRHFELTELTRDKLKCDDDDDDDDDDYDDYELESPKRIQNSRSNEKNIAGLKQYSSENALYLSTAA